MDTVALMCLVPKDFFVAVTQGYEKTMPNVRGILPNLKVLAGIQMLIFFCAFRFYAVFESL